MYDYNFPEQLTIERLTLLLLSLVIPTDSHILQIIYKKKKELEMKEYHNEIRDISEQNGWILDGFKDTCVQINALYPNFIMYCMEYDWTENDELVHTYALTEWRGSGWGACSNAPKGVSVINHLFKYWTPQLDRARNYKRSRFKVGFKIEYNNNINYEELNDKITKFRQYEDLLNTSNEPNLLYEDIKEINEDFGIRVDDYFNIECY